MPQISDAVVHAMANALYVLTLSRATIAWLQQNDPEAYRQATRALDQYERVYCQESPSRRTD